MPSTAPDKALTPFFVDLVLDELGAIDTLRLEAIMSFAQRPKITLLVTTIDREGPLVLDFESRSSATPRTFCRPVLALVAGPFEDALAYLGGNIAGLRPVLSFWSSRNLVRTRLCAWRSFRALPLEPPFTFPLRILLLE